ncbi:MAG: TolC family protein [Myxococcota bacterium]
MSALLLVLLAQVTTPEPTPPPSAIVPEGPVPSLVTDSPKKQADLEPTTSLKELLELVEKSNVDRMLSVEAVHRAEADLNVAWSALFPAVTLSGVWTHNQYATVIPAGTFGPSAVQISPADQLDGVLKVDLSLVDVSRWARVSASRDSREAAAARDLASRDMVRRALALAWFSYAGALALKDSAERTVTVAEAQLKLQEIRQRSGATTELDLLRSRAEVERNRQSVADAVRLSLITRRSIQTLTGKDPGPAARLPEVDLSPAMPLEELEKGVDALPQVRAALKDLETAHDLTRAATLALVLPTVGAQFTERLTNASGFSGHDATFNLGLNFAWRLDGPGIMNRDVADSNENSARLAAEKVRLVARDLIHSDWQSLVAAQTKVKAAQVQVEAASRAQSVAATRYQVGATTQLEEIQAERDLFGAEVQLIQARSELASARVALQLSAGLALEVP